MNKQTNEKDKADLQNYNDVSVFLSYSHKDEKEMDIIESTVLNEGVPEKNIFRDTGKLKAGDLGGKKIREAIEKANLCLFLWTKNSYRSEEVRKERTRAYDFWDEHNFNKGTWKTRESSRPYCIVDILIKELSESDEQDLKNQLKRYRDPQRIQFETREEFIETFDKKVEEKLTPTLQKIQRSYISSPRDQQRTIEGYNTIEKLMSIASRLVNQHRYEDALVIYRAAKKESERNLSILEESEKIDIDTQIGRVCYLLGRYQEAETLYKEMLEKQETILGKDHPNTLTTMHNLAGIYNAQGRYQEAETLYKEVQEKKEAILGKNHTETLATMHNLAGIYNTQGRYQEAETLYKEVFEKVEAILGKDHPNTLTTMNNLALLYQARGKVSRSRNTL